jgi:nitrite reductase/ring-hydroxylating ferredoxin subunit
MGSDDKPPTGPDLTAGIAWEELPEATPLVGHVENEAVLLVRRGEEVFATGASCTHYSGPLGEGLVVGDTVRCPWHHARFSLRTGEAIGAPALNPIPCWEGAARGWPAERQSQARAAAAFARAAASAQRGGDRGWRSGGRGLRRGLAARRLRRSGHARRP